MSSRIERARDLLEIIAQRCGVDVLVDNLDEALESVTRALESIAESMKGSEAAGTPHLGSIPAAVNEELARVHAIMPGQLSGEAAQNAVARPLPRSLTAKSKAGGSVRREQARVPNATAGQPYLLNQAKLDEFMPSEGVNFVAPLPLGMMVDERGLLGAPQEAGEFAIRWEQRSVTLAGELLLTVNADPRLLWKDTPSDTNDVYWKPDADSKGGESLAARAVVASVRGRSHAHVGSFRDDDFALHVAPFDEGVTGWHVLVVADGAGSAKSSRRGSQIACEVVRDNLLQTLNTPTTEEARAFAVRTLHASELDMADNAFWNPHLYHVLVPSVVKAQEAIRAEAERIGANRKEFHTTLLVAIVRQTTSGEWFVGTYWIGDGAIGMWDPSWGAPRIFGEPDAGEFAGETTFLTYEDFVKSDQVARRLRYSIIPSFSYLALMTDGISDPKFDGETRLKSPEAWAAFTADLQTSSGGAPLAETTEAQLLEWIQFWSKGNHDDRTLLLFHPLVPVRSQS